MATLLVLVDTLKYIKTNCYQHQVYATLKKHYRLKPIELAAIQKGKKIPKTDQVISLLKLRSVDKNLDAVQRYLGGRQLFLYEQDPWEAFREDSPYYGAYGRICSSLNVRAFLNTSQWWSNYINSKGHPSRFVRMGMLPKYCKFEKTWEKRKHHLAFQGTVHPHRKKFFDQLEALGLHVETLKGVEYHKYIKSLSDIRVYLHSEDDPWLVEGKLIPRNALWIKNTEVAARGTFSIRNFDEDAKAYGIQDLPTCYTFNRVEEVPEIVHQIESMDPRQRNERMRAAVEMMKKRNDWETIVTELKRG